MEEQSRERKQVSLGTRNGLEVLKDHLCCATGVQGVQFRGHGKRRRGAEVKSTAPGPTAWGGVPAPWFANLVSLESVLCSLCFSFLICK